MAARRFGWGAGLRGSSRKRAFTGLASASACALALLLIVGCSTAQDPTTASGPGATAQPTSSSSAPGTSGRSGTPGTSSTEAPPPASAPAKATGAAKPSPGCAAERPETITPGTVLDTTIVTGDKTHPYRLYVPASLTNGAPAPLVLDLHGLTQPRNSQAAVSGWEALSETERFIVLTPQGGEAVPNWSATVADDNPDTAYLRALIDKTQTDLCVDLTRVYVGGISNGGLESSIIGCKLVDKVAAVGLVAGIVVPEPCRSAPPMPVIVFWGKLDCVLPFYGGLGPCLGPRQPGVVRTAPSEPPVDNSGVPPVEASVKAWSQRNGCGEEPTTMKVSEHTEKITYDSCRNGAAVELYVVSNGGHTWPGSKLAASQDKDLNSPQGITTMEIDATALLWEFYQRFQVAA